jgi:hypothetical protein
MADKVSNVHEGAQRTGQQIDRQTILLNIVWFLLPASCRSELWGNFHERYKSSWHLLRETFNAIRGVIRSQTEEAYYPGMAIIQMLTMTASLLGTITPFRAGILALFASAGLLVRDAYMDPTKRGYACFLWDAVTAIALLAILQVFAVLRSPGPLRAAVPLIGVQALAGGASASFFRLIFKMPPNPLDRAYEDYRDIFRVNVLWFTACIALIYPILEMVPFDTPGIDGFLIAAPIMVASLRLHQQREGLGGAQSPRLTSISEDPDEQDARVKNATLIVPTKALAGRLLEVGFFVLLGVPVAAALRKWWTNQDAGIDWSLVRANTGSLLILSIFWIRMRQLNDETIKALQEKVKAAVKERQEKLRAELKAKEKPPEETDDHI